MWKRRGVMTGVSMAAAVWLLIPHTAYAAEPARGCFERVALASVSARQYLVKVFAIRNPDKPLETMSKGSGELVRGPSGVVRVITNVHVVGARATHAYVQLDGAPYAHKVRILGIDAVVDLALLEAPSPLPISAIPIVLAAAPPSDGDCVYALGYPAGARRVTAGVVVSPSSPLVEYGFDMFFSHQAPVAPGSSGGALVRFDTRGLPELLGVNTRGLVQQLSDKQFVGNISFALHARVIQKTIEILETRQVVEHAFLGFMIVDVKDLNPFFFEYALGRAYPPAPGTLVVGVKKDSPAAEAGVRSGDTLIGLEASIDGRWYALPMTNAGALTEEVFFNIPPGTRVRLTLGRGSQTMNREFILGAHPEPSDS